MIEVLTYKYRGIEVSVNVCDRGFFHCFAFQHIDSQVHCHNHLRLSDAQKIIDKRIDNFLALPKTTWRELTDTILEIVIVDYDGRKYVNEEIIKHVVLEFINQSKESDLNDGI